MQIPSIAVAQLLVRSAFCFDSPLLAASTGAGRSFFIHLFLLLLLLFTLNLSRVRLVKYIDRRRLSLCCCRVCMCVSVCVCLSVVYLMSSSLFWLIAASTMFFWFIAWTYLILFFFFRFSPCKCVLFSLSFSRCVSQLFSLVPLLYFRCLTFLFSSFS